MRAADFHSPHAVFRRRGCEAVVEVGLRRHLRIGGVERDVIEVVLHLGRRLDEANLDAARELVVVGPLDGAHAECDMLERTALARPFGVEQRQLSVARMRTDQREVLLLVDDVHAEVTRREIGDRVPLGDPEGDVIQGCRIHAVRLAI